MVFAKAKQRLEKLVKYIVFAKAMQRLEKLVKYVPFGHKGTFWRAGSLHYYYACSQPGGIFHGST